MVRKIYMYICTYVSHPRANAYVRMRILLETSQDTVYLRPDHCFYRSRVIRVETDMETWLVCFIYRTPSRNKGTVMDSTAPIYLGWNLIEDSPQWEYTQSMFHLPCTLQTSRFYFWSSHNYWHERSSFLLPHSPSPIWILSSLTQRFTYYYW